MSRKNDLGDDPLDLGLIRLGRQYAVDPVEFVDEALEHRLDVGVGELAELDVSIRSSSSMRPSSIGWMSA